LAAPAENLSQQALQTIARHSIATGPTDRHTQPRMRTIIGPHVQYEQIVTGAAPFGQDRPELLVASQPLPLGETKSLQSVTDTSRLLDTVHTVGQLLSREHLGAEAPTHRPAVQQTNKPILRPRRHDRQVIGFTSP